MPCPDRLSQWSQEVSTAFGHLSKPQVWGLVLWSAGIALSGAAYHLSQKVPVCFCLASTRTQTGAETPRTGKSADSGLTAPKNLYLKGGPPPQMKMPT